MINTRNGYEHYKAKWENTKPIRGRSKVVKPIGQRRRDWETIEKREIDGQEVYACHLYQTDVVKYYPDGSIEFNAEQWSTPLSAEFMSMHSPFYCQKQHGKLWVNVRSGAGDKVYPVPREGGLRLYPKVVGSDTFYEPKETIMIKKKVVDRVKAKQAREKLRGFLDWAKTFNKLSDGWIRNETREQFGTPKAEYWRVEWDYGLPEGMVYTGYASSINFEKAYEYLQTCDDVGYMKIYLAMFDGGNHHDKKLDKTLQATGNPSRNPVSLYDFQYNWDYAQRKIYEIADRANDIYKEVEVEAGSKPVTKVVG